MENDALVSQGASTNQLSANEIWPRRTRKTPFKTTAPAALSYRLASSVGPAHSSQKPARAASSSTTSCGRRAATMEVEPPPLEERRRLQEELSEFVESCCRTLEEVTASLGWSLDQLDPGDEAAAEVREAVAWPFRGCGLLAQGKTRVRSRSLRTLHPGAVQRRTGLVRCCLWAWRVALSSVKRIPHCVKSQCQESRRREGVGVEFSFLYLKSGRLSVPVLERTPLRNGN